MTDIMIGQFFPGNSVIHRLDPRTKLLFTLFYMVLIFFVDNFAGFILIGAFTALMIGTSGVPVRYYFKGLKPILYLMIFTSVFNLFLTQGEVLVTIPRLGWTITYEGVRMSAFMLLRLVFLLVGTSTLTFTTSPIILTDGLERLLSPLSKIKVPAHEIAMMMTIALRFIPTLLDETDKIKKAQAARGADFESGGLISRAKAMIPILVPLFVSAFRRADELAVAMEVRCYQGGEGRTSLKQLVYKRVDLLPVAIAVVLTVGVVVLNLFAPF